MGEAAVDAVLIIFACRHLIDHPLLYSMWCHTSTHYGYSEACYNIYKNQCDFSVLCECVLATPFSANSFCYHLCFCGAFIYLHYSSNLPKAQNI